MLIVDALIVLAAVVLMEGVAALAHRYVMHGRLGWRWHRSHHENGARSLETNDLYAVVFAAISVALVGLGESGVWPLTQVGAGLAIYGALYFVVHDGLVHRRWPFRYVPRHGYLKRLVQAHRLHHAVTAREGCVSFGFLYAPPLDALRGRLRAGGAAAAGGRRKV